MMSGRGLGHTGGTLDKLESIPGFKTALSLADAEKQIAKIGCAMLSQTAEIVPADRKLYALRDATATVEVIPLIAASIMSKKLAEGLTGLVLDVKRGSGSYAKLDDVARAGQGYDRSVARHGCPVVALLTAMDRPLGHAGGNASRDGGSNRGAKERSGRPAGSLSPSEPKCWCWRRWRRSRRRRTLS